MSQVFLCIIATIVNTLYLRIARFIICIKNKTNTQSFFNGEAEVG